MVTLDSGPLSAIDIGSNSFRLEIGQLRHGRYRRIDYLKDVVRLGAGLDDAGRLTESAVQRGLDSLQRFAARLHGFAPSYVRAVATQTLREASNRNAFLARAEQVLGYPVEIISGREEARLIYVGVATLQPSPKARLVIDIGGRSTEMILGQGATPNKTESFAVGSVSLSMRYFGDGRLDAAAFRAAQIAAGAEFEEALATFAPPHWQEAMGSSGTVGAVSEVLLAAGITDGGITSQALAWMIERCIAAGHVDLLQLPGLRADRRAVLPGGLAILYTLFAHFGIRTLWPAKGALRQGIVIDLRERLDAARRARGVDLRDATARQLQARFAVDTAQAGRVSQRALDLFDQLAPSGAVSAAGKKRDPGDAVGAQREQRRELAWACDLHEVGMSLSHHDHHRHSAYMLAHVEAPGFSQSQQRRLSDLVLAQRGGLRKIDALLEQPVFALQALCLRLAVLICHARDDSPSTALTLSQPDGASVSLSWPPAGDGLNPRTLHLLGDEAQAWLRSGRLRLQLPEVPAES